MMTRQEQRLCLASSLVTNNTCYFSFPIRAFTPVNNEVISYNSDPVFTVLCSGSTFLEKPSDKNFVSMMFVCLCLASS